MTDPDPLTPEEIDTLRSALDHGDHWPETTAVSLLPRLLATLDAERAARAPRTDWQAEAQDFIDRLTTERRASRTGDDWVAFLIAHARDLHGCEHDFGPRALAAPAPALDAPSEWAVVEARLRVVEDRAITAVKAWDRDYATAVDMATGIAASMRSLREALERHLAAPAPALDATRHEA